jgi:Major capsid protein Gp23
MNIPQTQVNDGSNAGIVRKWSKLLDYSSDSVKPIVNEHVYKATAMLLENQEKWCIQESNVASSGGVFGATQTIGSGIANTDSYASGDARLPKILIPMIRRTFPELISNEIVGVQPMGGPVGLAFALRYAYQGETLGTGIDGKTVPVPGANPRGNGSTDYTGNAGLPGDELGYQLLDTRFTGASSAFLSGHAEWSFADQDRGVAELLKDYELTGNIPQIELKFEKTAVEAGTRRLATRWAVELEQDIKNMNGIDIDGELTNAMSYEIQAEIDREVVMRMIQTAFNAGFGAGYSIWSPVSADGRWTAERNLTFYQRLIIEAGRMAARNRRGAANFVIATPRVCSILEMLPDFKTFEITGTVSTTGVGIAKVGTVGSRFTVYRDTRTEVQNSALYSPNYYTGQTSGVEYALLGYKGSEYYDTGIIYCPYIPIMVQRTIGANDFAPRVGLMTRYGIVNNIFGAALYYHLIIVKGLGTAFTPGSVSTYL